MDASVPSEVSLSGEPQPSHPSPRDASHLREVAFLFTRLGFTAFGGPAAHVAMMEDEVVRRRGWIDRRHFLDLVGTLNFIPGPNSTELAIHLGLIRAGLRGLVTAGVCFITPAVLIILPLAWAYVRFGQVYPVRGAMRGIAGAVVAIVAVAGWRFARTAVTDGFTGALAVGAPVGEYFLNRWVGRPYWLQPELAVLALGGLAGVIRLTGIRAGATRTLPLIGLGLPGALLAAADVSPWREMARLAGFFLKVGATLFGSGYVLVSYPRRPGGRTRRLADQSAIARRGRHRPSDAGTAADHRNVHWLPPRPPDLRHHPRRNRRRGHRDRGDLLSVVRAHRPVRKSAAPRP
jgi:chromate transporter